MSCYVAIEYPKIYVEMMSFPGIGNNPMVGYTVACAVDVAQALNK